MVTRPTGINQRISGVILDRHLKLSCKGFVEVFRIGSPTRNVLRISTLVLLLALVSIGLAQAAPPPGSGNSFRKLSDNADGWGSLLNEDEFGITQETGRDLTVSKVNNVSGATTLGNSWTWTITVNITANSDFAVLFLDGETVFTDTLPGSNIS